MALRLLNMSIRNETCATDETLQQAIKRRERKKMKRTLILMTVLNVVMMIAGISTVLAGEPAGPAMTTVATPEPASILLVLAGLLGIAGISRRKKK
jgi:hypothetical protein